MVSRRLIPFLFSSAMLICSVLWRHCGGGAGGGGSVHARGIEVALRAVLGHPFGVAFEVMGCEVLPQVAPDMTRLDVGWVVCMQQVCEMLRVKTCVGARASTNGGDTLGRRSPYWGRHCGASIPVVWDVSGKNIILHGQAKTTPS